MTVSAPRSRIICAISRIVRDAKESITSIAVTSMMIPRARACATFSTKAQRSCSRSESVRAAWTVAIKISPCLRIGTSTPLPFEKALVRFDQGYNLVAQQSLGLFDATLQVAHSIHLAEVNANVDQRLGNLRRKAGDDHGGAQQA